MKLIRITEQDYDTDLFRIFPMHWFLEVLETGKMTFAKPRLWKDPMDRLLFEYYFKNKKQKENTASADYYFAQCWTLKYESQSLWNEYAPLHNGVRVKTKIGKLYELFNDHALNRDENSWHMGSVDYLPIDEIKERLENSADDIPEAEIAHTLLVKLWQYSHEQEVRIIFNCRDESVSSGDIFRDIAINPLKLFDKLLMDPRMPENIFNVYKDYFIRQGFKEDQISRSALYDEELLRQKVMNFDHPR